jgi:putative phage-type endonuclease
VPTYHFDIEQGTPEWDDIRAGKWSASKAAIIMGGLDTKGLSDLIMDIAWGRMYGPTEAGGYKSAAMERGNNLEPESRERYSFLIDAEVETCGFVEHSRVPYVGWSPDGLVGRKRGIEAKNPLHKAYMEVVRTGKIPSEYRWQCKWGIWVGELESMDFLCHHPKAGLIVLPAEVSDLEKEQMEERVSILEPKVFQWMDILSGRKTNAQA